MKGVAGPLRAPWLRPKQTDLVHDKGQFRSRFYHPLCCGCSTTIFLDPRNRRRHHLSATLLDGGLETAGSGCYDAVAIALAAGFRMLVMRNHAPLSVTSEALPDGPEVGTCSIGEGAGAGVGVGAGNWPGQRPS
jgi:hypothetical protein